MLSGTIEMYCSNALLKLDSTWHSILLGGGSLSCVAVSIVSISIVIMSIPLDMLQNTPWIIICSLFVHNIISKLNHFKWDKKSKLRYTVVFSSFFPLHLLSLSLLIHHWHHKSECGRNIDSLSFQSKTETPTHLKILNLVLNLAPRYVEVPSSFSIHLHLVPLSISTLPPILYVNTTTQNQN